MTSHKDFNIISRITPNIYISGVPPIDSEKIKEYGINYILCCFDRNYISELHDQIMMNNPDLTILYLPYNDDVYQNLWISNKNQAKLLKYVKNMQDHDKLLKQNKLYQNKPMIEIGYNFIDEALSSGGKILVHCMAGVSRSVSLVTYYLMKKYGLKYEDAVRTIKNKRKIANPNESFKKQLITYHQKKDKFSESDVEKIIKEHSKKS